jgi:hypothetical protein
VVAAAAALAAAFLNAAFGLCLGCEVYLAVRRLRHRPLPARSPADPRRPPTGDAGTPPRAPEAGTPG